MSELSYGSTAAAYAKNVPNAALSQNFLYTDNPTATRMWKETIRGVHSLFSAIKRMHTRTPVYFTRQKTSRDCIALYEVSENSLGNIWLVQYDVPSPYSVWRVARTAPLRREQ